MKKQKLLAALAAVILLTSCNTDSADNAEEQSVTASQTAASVSETSAETTAEIPEETEVSDNSDTEPEYVEVSAGNEFIDFEFIEDYQGTSDIGDLADKAAEYLAEEFIAGTSQWNFLFSEVPDTIPDEFADYIDSDGKILPKFQTAYPNDYDGDGKTETFIVLNAPRFEYDVMQSYLVFAGSDGNMELIDSFCNPSPVQFLNYGMDKQIIFGGEGVFGVETHSTLFGVKYSKSIVHYRLRGSFRKENCFLSSFGFQGSGALMYYDTVMREYHVIDSANVDIEDIRAMDKTGVFEEYYGEDSPFSAFRLVGGKYYCLIKSQMMDWGEPYIYENGEFIKLENSHIRVSYDMYGLPCVIDIDMDKAVAEMKPPVEPYAKVSEDNVFIDYRFIEDYQGTTDIGVLAAGAVEFLTKSEYYAESTENIGEFTDEKFKKYFDESGNILPRLQTAYPEDYDGDGSMETFIIVDMPYMVWNVPAERSFLIFADSRGEMTLLSDASYLYKTIVLDYGDFKQITFGGYGTMGADDHTLLYGVVGGEVKKLYIMRGDFFKTNCFLTTIGWQSGGAFMYYDTTACEYRAISGIDVPIEKIKEMDSTNALSEFYEHFDKHGYLYAQFVGGRYYVLIRGVMDTGTAYLYENGEFIQTDECKYIRSCSDGDMKHVVDIDINKAIAEMKPVTN
ncbi:MAG: hypothetical protein K2N60_03195 [Oscillospiraceae bacterium]|nr:hypothetical protein [Oscillospiraceae bacterium]